MKLAGIAGAALIAFCLSGGGAALAAVLDQTQLTIAPPVNDAPRWYNVTASGAGNGTVLARSLSTGQPIGYLTSGYRFLAFGANQEIVTLALGGQVAFIPASAVTELYPTPPAVVEWKAYGPTLEDRAELERKKAKAAQAKGLEPLAFKKQAEAKKMMEMPGGVAGVPGGVPGGVPRGGGVPAGGRAEY